MKIERTHDYIYLTEDYKSTPKEYYKECGNFIEKELSQKNGKIRILDVGCETGSFLYYLERRFPHVDLYGMDVIPELIEVLKKMGDRVTGIVADISDSITLPNDTYDIVTMFGVMSIFDDFRPIIKNLISLLKDDGVAYIFGIFNPESIDVLIKSKAAEKQDDKWETGWNLFSIKSIELYCSQIGVSYKFLPFNIDIDINKREDDPLRSWTIRLPDDKRMIINGLQIVHHFYFLRISK